MASYYTNVYKVIDSLTGEILDERTVKFSVKKDKPREYVKVYVDMLNSISTNLTDGEKGVWIELFNYVSMDTGKITVDAEVKQKIANNLGTTVNAVAIALSKLVKKKVIYRRQRGVYYANPIFFWRGSENSKDSVMKIIIKMEEE